MKNSNSLYVPASVPSDHPPRRRRWVTVLKAFLLLLLLATAAVFGAGLSLLGQFSGESSPFRLLGVTLPRTMQVMQDPRHFFPGQSRLTVMCLGLDRNIMISKDPKVNGMPSTKNARTDVMMIASLDLEHETASILSIPRDTRVELPGRHTYSKINDAHARGGIPYTREAVEQFLGVPMDHYVVIKQEAIEAVVNALGGIEVDVEKDMDYDDDWGQLHIHLKEGKQVLDGRQVVGYMRFRHDHEGDFGRIRRQQKVIQTLSHAVKSPGVLLRAPQLIAAIRQFVQTDLSPEQQLALANVFHKLNPGNLTTLQLPVSESGIYDGVAYVIPDEEKKEAAVDWILNGNQDAMNRLLRVQLLNSSGSPALYQRVYRYLKYQGFDVWRAGRASGGPVPSSRVVQRTKIQGSGRHLLETLGVGGEVEKSDETGSDLTLYVGKDLLNSDLAKYGESYDTQILPDGFSTDSTLEPELESDRRSRRHRRRRDRNDDEPVTVDVRPVEPAREPSSTEPQPTTLPAEPGTEPTEPRTDQPGTQ